MCAGSSETCLDRVWPGCDDAVYQAWNPGYQNPEASCGDGNDNDCDSCVDGVDSDCGGIETVCSDSVDNDCDGNNDCNDNDCIADPYCSANVWSCLSSGHFDDPSCWSGGSVPVSGDIIRFDSTGTGDCNITGNSMPQDLSSFTVEPSFTGTIIFGKDFAYSGSSGTQVWNVTGDISIYGGTMEIHGDDDGIPAEGLGQEWRSLGGDIAIGSGVVLDGIGLGFPKGAANGPCASAMGACHALPSCGSSITYGTPTAPTSLGSSGGKFYTGGGGSAIMLRGATVSIDGDINMYGNNGDWNGGAGSGGSIWLDGDVITGSGTLNVRGEDIPSNTNRGASSAGRVALTAIDSIDFSGDIFAFGGDEYYNLGGITNCNGSGGTVYIEAQNRITSSGTINCISKYIGGNITMKSDLLMLSGAYAATGTGMNGTITSSYTDCSSDMSGAFFEPDPLMITGC